MEKEKKSNVPTILVTAAVTLVISIMGFYGTRLYSQLDSKVSRDQFVQFISLIEERQATQQKINDALLKSIEDANIQNAQEHRELKQHLEQLDKEFYQLKIEVIGFMTTRNDSERWNYDEITLFILENYDKIYPKYIGLI